MTRSSSPPRGAGPPRRRVLVTSRVREPRLGGRFVRVELLEGGELDCPDLPSFRPERDRIVARLLAGTPHDGAGAPELAALVAVVQRIYEPEHGLDLDAHDSIRALYIRYEEHSCLVEALRRHARATADPRRPLLERALLRTGYWPAGEWTAEEILRRVAFDFDTPVPRLRARQVALFREDDWRVPIAPDWRRSVHDAGLAVLDGKLVCARDPFEPTRLYAIAPCPDGSYRVKAFRHDARTGRLYPPTTAGWHLRHRPAEEAEQRRFVLLLRRALRDRR